MARNSDDCSETSIVGIGKGGAATGFTLRYFIASKCWNFSLLFVKKFFIFYYLCYVINIVFK